MSEQPALGKLIEVDIRSLWKHEQYNFSEWLALQENIGYLDDALGMTLTDVNKEVYVGSYRCDLVAKDETTGSVVIIENQLEASDHNHLGKIITYASGLGASVVVWIVKEAKEEHRSAIEWLNNNTGSDLGFFLIEIQAFKIGNSLPAPMFKVVEGPNDFIKMGSKGKEIGAAGAKRYEFWTKLQDVLEDKGKPFNIAKPSHDHWNNVAVGTSEAKIEITLVNKNKKICLALYINDNKDLFDSLYKDKDEIETKLDMKFDWDRLTGKKSSRIKYDIPGLDFDNQDNYPELMDEVVDKVIKMKNVFKGYLSKYI